eukprot:2899655-Alexandrium_andersonii.AAC.1
MGGIRPLRPRGMCLRAPATSVAIEQWPPPKTEGAVGRWRARVSTCGAHHPRFHVLGPSCLPWPVARHVA